MQEQQHQHSGWHQNLLLALIVMAGGRAMTLAFVARAGDGGPGDPPAVWLMPLLGDAAIGIAAAAIAWSLWRLPGLASWTAAIGWSAIGAFDALAAYVVNRQAPWPEFFMLKAFGPAMFFAATAMHLVIIWLLVAPPVRARHGVLHRAAATR